MWQYQGQSESIKKIPVHTEPPDKIESCDSPTQSFEFIPKYKKFMELQYG
jgi:hypothetical protein